MKLIFKLPLLFAAGTLYSSYVRVNNPYALPVGLNSQPNGFALVESAKQSFQFNQERQLFLQKIEPLLLSYHKRPFDIYSGRRNDIFLEVCSIVRSTPCVILNSELKIGSLSFQKQVAQLMDKELIEVLVRSGFDPEVSYAPNDSLRKNLEFLHCFYSRESGLAVNVPKSFVERCLIALPLKSDCFKDMSK